MPKGWVFDSSVLIVFGKVGCLELLGQLPGKLLVPMGVATELADGKSTDPAKLWLGSRICPVKSVVTRLFPTVAEWNLGLGESEVISLAKIHPGFVAVLDDRLGRSCATSLAVPVMGTIGLLLWMKKAGQIPAVRPYLEGIAGTDFWLDQTLFNEALRLAGEK